jgi:membrane protein implicated in regulation of membrane protease activity
MNEVDNSDFNAVASLPEPETNVNLTAEQRRITIIIIAIAIVVFIVIIGSFLLLMNAKPAAVAQLRDVFIIFLALQSLLIGLVLVILMVQLARLINLLQNEIKPILESTNETVSNLRGTTTFLSDNVVEPIIKMNEYMAGLMKFVAVLGLTRSKKN